MMRSCTPPTATLVVENLACWYWSDSRLVDYAMSAPAIVEQCVTVFVNAVTHSVTPKNWVDLD